MQPLGGYVEPHASPFSGRLESNSLAVVNNIMQTLFREVCTHNPNAGLFSEGLHSTPWGLHTASMETSFRQVAMMVVHNPKEMCANPSQKGLPWVLHANPSEKVLAGGLYVPSFQSNPNSRSKHPSKGGCMQSWCKSSST